MKFYIASIFFSTVQEDPTKESERDEETLDEKGLDVEKGDSKEDAVDMTQEFGGDVTDLPEDEEEEGSEGESCS